TNVAVEAKVNVASGAAGGLVARWGGVADVNYYYTDITGSPGNYQARLFVNLGGSFFFLGSGAVSRGVGALRLEVGGHTQQGFFDAGSGSKLITFAFAGTLPGAGTVGLRAAGTPNAVKYDDFNVSPITPPSVSLATPYVADFNAATRQQLGTDW